MRYILSLLFIAVFLHGATIKDNRWKSGETLLTFFKENHVPQKLYYSLDARAKELTEEIVSGVRYYVLKDENKTLKQALIPINEELQIHIYKKNGKYKLKLIPVIYQEHKKSFVLKIENSPYQDLIKKTGDVRLAKEFILAFKHSINFKRSIKKGDKLAIIYEEKIRLGKIYGSPDIKAAMIETHGKPHYVFNFKDQYYDKKGRSVEAFLFKAPLRHIHVTSPFTLRRYHPILHIYRAHLGTDFRARVGTPVMAAGNGRVIFAGRQHGYGNVVIIKHGFGYKTLYAHLSKFRRGIRAGKYVKQGQIIAYSGKTGLCRGPHLHFGVYKNNRAINPMHVLHIAKIRLYGKKKRKFLKFVKKYKKELQNIIASSSKPKKYQNFQLISYLNALKDEQN